MSEKKVAWASPMSAAVNAVAQAIKDRRAERERSAKLTVLQRLAAEDAATEAKEPKRKVSAGAGRKVIGALEVGASLAVTSVPRTGSEVGPRGVRRSPFHHACSTTCGTPGSAPNTSFGVSAQQPQGGPRKPKLK